MERESSGPSTNGNSPVPQELASRLLDSHYPYTLADERPGIFVGRLPDEPPFEVPIPEGFILLGSVTSEPLRGRRMIEVVLDTELPAERVRGAYRALLTASGWTEDRRATDPGGFARGPRGFLMAFIRVLSRSSRRPFTDLRGLSAVFDRNDRRHTLVVSASSPAATRWGFPGVACPRRGW